MIGKKIDFKSLSIIVSILSCIFINYKFENIKLKHKLLKEDVIPININSTVVYISGYYETGIKTMRSIFDGHPLLSCNNDIEILPRIVSFTKQHLKHTSELKRLNEAGITKEIINAAAGAFMVQIIKSHDHYTPYLCNEDSNSLFYAEHIVELFPNLKFILMVRNSPDSIPVEKSILEKEKNKFEPINHLISICNKLGPDYCLQVYYDRLITETEIETKKVFKYLNIPWHEAVLNRIEKIN